MRSRTIPLVMLLAALASPAGAQTIIPDEPTCARCTITMRDIVTLNDTSAAHMPDKPYSVVEDGRGRYWLTYSSHLPLIYGADGRFLRELGPKGDGPDEYRSAPMVRALPGDSVLVYDGARNTYFVLGPNLQVGRSVKSGTYYGQLAVLEWPEVVLVKGTGRVEPGPVYLTAPLQYLSLGGPAVLSANTFGEGWAGGASVAGPFAAWTWEYNPYRLKLWTGAALTHDLERRPSWFPTTDIPMVSPQANQLPPAHIQAAQQDGAGRLWVFVNEPVEVWQQGALHPGREMERYYRTRVEVIDPRAGRVIASTRLDAFIVSALPGGRAAVYGTNARGTPYVRIVQLALVQ